MTHWPPNFLKKKDNSIQLYLVYSCSTTFVPVLMFFFPFKKNVFYFIWTFLFFHYDFSLTLQNGPKKLILLSSISIFQNRHFLSYVSLNRKIHQPQTCTISFFHGFSSLELVLFQYNFAYPKKMYCLVYIWWDPKDLEKRENDYAMSISFSPTLQFVFLISSCFLLPCVFFISFILCL